jgi:hypothetical protein
MLYIRVLKENLNLRNEINKYTCVYVDFITYVCICNTYLNFSKWLQHHIFCCLSLLLSAQFGTNLMQIIKEHVISHVWNLTVIHLNSVFPELIVYFAEITIYAVFENGQAILFLFYLHDCSAKLSNILT